MIEKELKRLLESEGYVFSSLLAEVIAGVLSVIILIQIVIPAVAHQRRIRKICKNLGGGPKCHWLYGNIHKYGYDQKGYNNLLDLHEKYPKLTVRWHGNFLPAIGVFHPDTARPLLSGNFAKGTVMTRIMYPIVKNGLILATGETWKFHRRVLTSFFHFDIIKSHVEIFNECCDDFLAWAGELAKTGEAGNIVHKIQQVTYEASMRAVFSVNVKEDVKSREFPEAVDTINHLAFQRLSNPLLLNDFIWFNMTERGKLMKKMCDKLHHRAGVFINKRKAMIAAAVDAPTITVKGKGTGGITQTFKITGDRHNVDFMDILLQAKDVDGAQIAEDDLRAEIQTFFAAGQETVATGLNWAIHCLACNKFAQDKVREEFFEKIGNKDFITSEEESKLTYMTMCIKESQRLFPILHVVGRHLDRDVKCPDGIVLPKGFNVNCNIYMLHRNPRLWDDPLTYDPERFTPERSEGRSPFAFIPFGAGPRNCIGQVFALHQTRVVLYQLLRKFEVYYDVIPEPNDIELTFGVTLQPTNGLHIKFRPVDNSSY